jgi:hypothetical protein
VQAWPKIPQRRWRPIGRGLSATKVKTHELRVSLRLKKEKVGGTDVALAGEPVGSGDSQPVPNMQFSCLTPAGLVRGPAAAAA